MRFMEATFDDRLKERASSNCVGATLLTENEEADLQ